ncbi:MAG: sodium:solute symporter family protein [Proteobacteria bacterium]|nr:sodium:solute symporter family protein [Pseudomonadota bacterium]
MLSSLDTLIVAFFLILMLVMGLRLRNKTKDAPNYLLGGRALTLPAFVATTVSTWYGGILGVGEYAWSYGIANWLVFGVPYYVGAILFALLLSRRARSSEVLSIPHRFEQYYGKKAAICAGILIFLTTVPGAYMLIMGTILGLSFGIGSALGILATALFVVFYLWRGGFNAVVRTDALQFALMFGGFIVLSLWLLIGYGTEPLSALPPSHLEPLGGQSIGSILIWYIIALSTLAEPNFFQRAYAAKTPQIARRGLLISVGFWVFFDAMTTLCGLYARALLPDLATPLHAFPALAAEVLPIGLVGLFFTGLLATVLSSLDSNLFTTAATLGRDLWPQKCFEKMDIQSRTRISLVIGAIIASTIALISDSVVKIWEVFGSMSAASLLIPILSSYYPKFRMSNRGSLVLMMVGCGVTVTWFIVQKITGELIFGLRPLLAGGIAAILCYLIDQIIRRKINAKSTAV